MRTKIFCLFLLSEKETNGIVTLAANGGSPGGKKGVSTRNSSPVVTKTPETRLQSTSVTRAHNAVANTSGAKSSSGAGTSGNRSKSNSTSTSAGTKDSTDSSRKPAAGQNCSPQASPKKTMSKVSAEFKEYVGRNHWARKHLKRGKGDCYIRNFVTCSTR